MQLRYCIYSAHRELFVYSESVLKYYSEFLTCELKKVGMVRS